ncbi:HAD family hydrolase [Enterococcus sp. AZ072]|uniref:HAD family hydrolase n=1 Tax=unclassified Enterococcus TaxID=2608891 RepID=UPI003D282287
MENQFDPYEMTKNFHHVFEPQPPEKPTPFSSERAAFRAGFKIEEIVEFVYGAAKGDQVLFDQMIGQLHENIEQAKTKILDKQEPVTDQLTAEVDALTDLLYFTYGSFALIGVDPQPIFEIVHQANMGKLFPDGKPHYHPDTHKVLKPENWEQDYAPEKLIQAELDKQKRQDF